MTPGTSLQRILPVSASPSPTEQRALDGVRVLLVEDTDDTRELLAFALEHCSAVVTTASSATEALESFRRDRPQILVTDLAMPATTATGCFVRSGPWRRGLRCRRWR